MQRIGFISTRLTGTDGVSLETHKWRATLEQLGYECVYVAGELDDGHRIPEAAFTHPEIAGIQSECFGREHRTRALSKRINDSLVRLKDELYRAQDKLKVDLWIAENCLTIPMHIPLGLSFTEFLAETGIPCIAHHHDFWWERERFATNAVNDYLHAAFPPRLPSVRHVVINSVAASQLSYRLGLSSTLIPNVMDFENPPPKPASGAVGFRNDLGLAGDDWLLLQPTRVVPRKQIEQAVELVKRLDHLGTALVITHSTGDEGDEYTHHICNYARLLGVTLKFAHELVERRYSLADVYASADLVTYPSGYEGFGNAFLEAIYYRRPIMCNRYSIFQTDIEPKGFKAITMNGFVDEDTVQHARRAIEDKPYAQTMVEHNYRLGGQYFSYRVLKHKLQALLTEIAGVCQ